MIPWFIDLFLRTPVTVALVVAALALGSLTGVMFAEGGGPFGDDHPDGVVHPDGDDNPGRNSDNPSAASQGQGEGEGEGHGRGPRQQSRQGSRQGSTATAGSRARARATVATPRRRPARLTSATTGTWGCAFPTAARKLGTQEHGNSNGAPWPTQTEFDARQQGTARPRAGGRAGRLTQKGPGAARAPSRRERPSDGRRRRSEFSSPLLVDEAGSMTRPHRICAALHSGVNSCKRG